MLFVAFEIKKAAMPLSFIINITTFISNPMTTFRNHPENDALPHPLYMQ